MSVDPETERMPRPRKIDTAIMALAFAILMQGALAIWWGAGLDNRVGTLERDTAPLRAMAETVGRLDERTKGIERIERKLDALEQRK